MLAFLIISSQVQAASPVIFRDGFELIGTVITPTSGLITTEAGGEDSFTVVLISEPGADVIIDLSSSDSTEGSVSPGSLTFSPGDWDTPQVVTVTGVDDADVDGDQNYQVVTAVTSSADNNYNDLNPRDVSVTNQDDDLIFGFIVTPTTVLTTEAGGSDTFTVVLASQPAADVTFDLSSSDITEGTVSPTSLTFTSADWDQAQTATVTGVDDADNDGNQSYSVLTDPATSADPVYNGVNPDDVSVFNQDNDGEATWVENILKVNDNSTNHRVHWNGSQFLAVGFDKNFGNPLNQINPVHVSSDGLNWETFDIVGEPAFGMSFRGIAWDGSTYVIVGPAGDIYSGNSSGNVWLELSDPTDDNRFQDIVWAKEIGRFLAAARFGIVAYSDDGVAWTTVDASNGADGGNATHDLEEVIWDGSKFIVASAAGILTSANGTAWVKNTELFDDDMRLSAIAFNGTTYVAMGRISNTHYTLTSTDGFTWTKHLQSYSADIVDMVWDGAAFVAVDNHLGIANDFDILTSTDGINWTGEIIDPDLPNELFTLQSIAVGGPFGNTYVVSGKSLWTKVK